MLKLIDYRVLVMTFQVGTLDVRRSLIMFIAKVQLTFLFFTLFIHKLLYFCDCRCLDDVVIALEMRSLSFSCFFQKF